MVRVVLLLQLRLRPGTDMVKDLQFKWTGMLTRSEHPQPTIINGLSPNMNPIITSPFIIYTITGIRVTRSAVTAMTLHRSLRNSNPSTRNFVICRDELFIIHKCE